ncbi:hypothetical protein [uncultured Hymenobacter sp.]|uniref:hypothetical protein n=1 Tax=uncultured Hymenobacter sp. TaxID=170016 RepID=UPI0035CB79DB
MKTLLLSLFLLATPSFVQAQTAPPSQLGLSEKFKLPPRSSGRVTAQQPPQLAPGNSYRSQPHTLRVVVPSSAGSKMPQAAAQSREGAGGGVQQLPLQQYLPDQPATQPERNSSWSDKHSGGKP